MKTKLMLMVIAALFMTSGCEKQEPLIRDAAIRETAENMGKAEAERFWNDALAIELRNVENKRAAVARATDARALVLAEDDLQEARRELRKIERKLEELKD